MPAVTEDGILPQMRADGIGESCEASHLHFDDPLRAKPDLNYACEVGRA